VTPLGSLGGWRWSSGYRQVPRLGPGKRAIRDPRILSPILDSLLWFPLIIKTGKLNCMSRQKRLYWQLKSVEVWILQPVANTQ